MVLRGLLEGGLLKNNIKVVKLPPKISDFL
jgi:hypothetical protein